MKDTEASNCESAALYMLLSECYYAPDEALLSTIREIGEKARGPYSELARTAPQADGLEALRIDHAKLFVGPFNLLAPPYGSTYLETGGRLMSDSTMDVGDWYRGEDLALALDDAPDHIILELEFMHYLVCMQILAAHRSDALMEASYRQKRRSFVESHLGKWISRFAAKVGTNAD